MPGYITSTLEWLQHPKPKQPQHAPQQWTQPAYGQKLQLAPIDETPKLEKNGIHFVQSCVGSLIYYARAVDATMLPAINEISGSQASPMQKTMSACKMLLDYAATYPLAPLPCKQHGSQYYQHRCSLSCPTQCTKSLCWQLYLEQHSSAVTGNP